MTTNDATEVVGTEEDWDDALGFDADAKVAAQAEAQLKPIPVRLGGRVWLFPHFDDWMGDVIEAANSGQFARAVELMFPDSDDIGDLVGKLPVSVIKGLLDHVQRKSGVDLGKGKRSGDPSKSSRRK